MFSGFTVNTWRYCMEQRQYWPWLKRIHLSNIFISQWQESDAQSRYLRRSKWLENLQSKKWHERTNILSKPGGGVELRVALVVTAWCGSYKQVKNNSRFYRTEWLFISLGFSYWLAPLWRYWICQVKACQHANPSVVATKASSLWHCGITGDESGRFLGLDSIEQLKATLKVPVPGLLSSRTQIIIGLCPN